MGTLVKVTDDACWICGKPFGSGNLMYTEHHALPKHLNPVRNLIVPIHQECHERLNATDIAGLTAFAFKILKSTEEVHAQALSLVSTLTKIEELFGGKKIVL